MKSIYPMLFVSMLAAAVNTASQASEPNDWVKAAALQEEPAFIALRHKIHQHPELGNQEFETSKLVAERLKALGIDVRTNVATTGVIGVLKGGKPGPVMALRADMDALPVQEPVGLPFASTARAQYQGKEVPVMHACGHDAHTAMLLGAAKLLADHRDQIAGTVVFVFQPAEEGGANIDNFTQGAEIGARKMIAEGALDNPKVEVIFGLHVMAGLPSGQIRYKPGPVLNSADGLRITVSGRKVHGSMPWKGADPVVASAQMITALQTLISRRADLSQGMGVVTIGAINAGTVGNIIPDTLSMLGTVRTNDNEIRNGILKQLPPMIEHVAQANGVSAKVELSEYAPVLMNDKRLTRMMAASMKKAADGNAKITPNFSPASEDFAHYAKRVPALFVFLGATSPDQDMLKAPVNHSPFFTVDDATLKTGVRAHVEFVLNYPLLAGLGAKSS